MFLTFRGTFSPFNDFKEDLMRKLRAIRVTYSDGTVITTNMAAHLTDEQAMAYFKVGKVFNLGTHFPDSQEDNEQVVVKAEILK